jgi:hypothetical protein
VKRIDAAWTPMAYDTFSRAFEVCEQLRSEIGVSDDNFKTEDDFLGGTQRYLAEILADPEDYLDSWNLLDDVNVMSFVTAVNGLPLHVTAMLKTPLSRRGKPPFEKATS